MQDALTSHNSRILLPMFILLSSVAVTVVGLIYFFKAREHAGPQNVQELLGQQTITALHNSTQVNAYRINADKKTTISPSIGGFQIVSADSLLSVDDSKRLVHLLLNSSTYRFGVGRLCTFAPELAFSLSGSGETVHVLLSFNCDEIRFETLNQNKRIVKRAGAEFDAARAELVNIVKRAFPKDDALQALSTTR